MTNLDDTSRFLLALAKIAQNAGRPILPNQSTLARVVFSTTEYSEFRVCAQVEIAIGHPRMVLATKSTTLSSLY